MYRFDIINKLIKENDFKSYLEIGVCNPIDCFDKIECEHKEGVDPGYEFEENPVDHELTSDQFFAFMDSVRPDQRYDVIFIDGLHKSYQVKQDIHNSLRYLNPNGYVVLHDCNPPDDFMARETYMVNGVYEPWNGTVWKAIYDLRTSRTDLKVCVVDTDWGIGIVKNNHFFDTKLVQKHNQFYEFNIMDANREEDLGLIQVDELDNWLYV